MLNGWIRVFATALGACVLVGNPTGALGRAAQDGPNQPPPQATTLDPLSTALLVLDMNERCADPAQVCSQLAPRLRPLLEKARAANVFIVYTVSANTIGTPLEPVWSGFSQRPNEPVIYPDGIDKFRDGAAASELHAMLQERGIRTVVITGSSSNMAVLYTATGAAWNYGYDVVIPFDGMNSVSTYQDEYTIHQFTVMVSGANQRFSYTTIDLIQFARPAGM